jgi:hypothetical protein
MYVLHPQEQDDFHQVCLIKGRSKIKGNAAMTPESNMKSAPHPPIYLPFFSANVPSLLRFISSFLQPPQVHALTLCHGTQITLSYPWPITPTQLHVQVLSLFCRAPRFCIYILIHVSLHLPFAPKASRPTSDLLGFPVCIWLTRVL